MFCNKQQKFKLFPILVVVCILLSACGTKGDIERICESYEDAIKEEIGLDDSTGLEDLGINYDDYPKLDVGVFLKEPIQPDDFLEKARDITSIVKSVMGDTECSVGVLAICLYKGDEPANGWYTKDYVTGSYFDYINPKALSDVTLDELISDQEDSNR